MLCLLKKQTHSPSLRDLFVWASVRKGWICGWLEGISIIMSLNLHYIPVRVMSMPLLCGWETDVLECEGSRSEPYSYLVVQVVFKEL